MNKIRRKEILILILCLIAGFALRFYTFDKKSLWIDEIHTYNDSRDGIQKQLEYYKENPTYLHPPMFFVLTHSFYPFTKPERDLRIIPLLFGILSIPMIYFLSRQFSPNIAIPCTLILTFMTYHIYFSQDGRMYSMLMFFGMMALYFFIKHLKTYKKGYLVLVAIGYAILFHTSYSSILFIVFTQILWFYHINENKNKFNIFSFLTLSGITLILCIPWVLFIVLSYKGQPVMDLLTIQEIGSLFTIVAGIFNDWAPLPPLSIASLILLILFPFFSKNKENSIILLALLAFTVGGLYFYCKLLNVNQFITSRYFITFFPLFLITLYLSLDAIEAKFKKFRGLFWIGPKLFFLILFILSNLIILFPYYKSEKQNFRGLVNYLNTHLGDGDKIVVGTFTYIPGILHYFKVEPKNRHYSIPYSWITPGKEFEFKATLTSQDRNFNIYHSNIPYSRYIENGNRLWILVGKGHAAEEVKKIPSCVLKGYFDGSFAMFRKFPSDASMYLFLWDSSSRDEKGINRQIE